MTPQGRRCLAVKIVFNVLAIVSAISIFSTFWSLRNFNAAIWGLISGVFSALTLWLHLVHRRNKLHIRFDAGSLKCLKLFGFFGCFASIVAAVVYIVLAVVFKQGYKLKDDGYMPAAIFCFLTLKCAAFLAYYSKKYGDILTSDKQMSPITGDSVSVNTA